MIVQSYAKINLSLNVKQRRSDGYHDISSIMVPIELYDTLDIRIDQEAQAVPCEGNVHRIVLTCDHPEVPCDERNLIHRAVVLYQHETKIFCPVLIHLSKRIPMEAGLGGGSSNAACTLLALNAMSDVKLSMDQLMKLGAQLGADVPFFLLGKPALVGGIGEQIQPIAFDMPMKLLLVKPKGGVATKVAYQTLNLMQCDHPDCNELQLALEHNQYETSLGLLGNSLEESAFRLCDSIAMIKKQMIELGFDTALMSGSGSTVFGVTKNTKILQEGFDFFHQLGYFVVETKVRLG